VTVVGVAVPSFRTVIRADPEVTPGIAETGTVKTLEAAAVVIVVVA
jgi:hypothetical protein